MTFIDIYISPESNFILVLRHIKQILNDSCRSHLKVVGLLLIVFIYLFIFNDKLYLWL